MKIKPIFIIKFTTMKVSQICSISNSYFGVLFFINHGLYSVPKFKNLEVLISMELNGFFFILCDWNTK